MLTNCFRFAPRDSVPGLIAKICKYLKDHPGWSVAELEDQIKQFIGQTGVESFNGRTGAVVLNEDDVNNLKIASAYFAEGDETIDELDLVALYNQGVRFVFTNWNSVTSGYDLAFVLDYFRGSNDVVYYPMATGSGGGGNIVSVNGKTGIVELSLSDILGDSGAQVKLCTATEFTSTTLTTWNAYYEDGYRIVGVVNSDASAIDYIYLLKQDDNNHQPIGLSAGASDAYTPNNPPPYPVTSVNGSTGAVTVSELRYGTKNPAVSAATLQLVEGRTPYVQTDGAGDYVGMAFGAYLDIAKDKIIHRVVTPSKGTRFVEEYDTINPPPYPVTSVNNETGDVSISRIQNINAVGEIFTSNINRTPAINMVGLGDFLNTEFSIYYDNYHGYVTARVKYPGTYDTAKGFLLYSDITPPPYPVVSVNGMTGAVRINEIKTARVTTEVFGDGYRHRFLKSSLPNLNTNLTAPEAILSVINASSVPMISSRFEYDGDYVTVSLNLLGGDEVRNSQTLTILYR